MPPGTLYDSSPLKTVNKKGAHIIIKISFHVIKYDNNTSNEFLNGNEWQTILSITF